MASKNNPGAYDCHANADPDEPMFVLLGRDPVAASVVRFWALMREALEYDEPEKAAEARACANAMETWASERLSKAPMVLRAHEEALDLVDVSDAQLRRGVP